MIIKKTLIYLIALTLINSTLNANAIIGTAKGAMRVGSKFINNSKSLSNKEIQELSTLLNKSNGTKDVGKILGKKQLPNNVIEDTFMRLAVHRKKISQKEASEMFMNLSGTNGFRTTLRKIMGNSTNKSSGHLQELRIANTAHKNSFTVKAIGQPFKDGIKKSTSDIDIILQKNNKTFAIEAKDYLSKTHMPLDTFRGDLDTLISYVQKNPNIKIIPIFSMTNKPLSVTKLKQLNTIAEQKGVQLIFGNHIEQIEQIKILGQIL